MTEQINEQNFNEKTADGLSIVDFWAPWCGPCRMQGPIIDELSDELNDVHVYKVNVDDNQNLSSQYGVMSIPTLFIMQDGEVKETLVGLHQKEDLVRILNQYR